MHTCPNCNHPATDPHEVACPSCGAFLSWAPARSESATAVAAALAGMVLAVVLAVGLALAGGGGALKRRPLIAAAAPIHYPASWPLAVHAPASPASPAPPRARSYRGRSYSFSYPVGWSVATEEKPIGDYYETVLRSRDGAAQVNVDHSPGETLHPAGKAAQVESAVVNRTPGYERVALHAASTGGRPSIEWVFKVPGAQRADLFVNTGHDGFAVLAYGADFARARAAAHAIAASLKLGV
jgi:hypothetical protein